MPSIHPLASFSAAAHHRVEAKYNVVTEYPNLRLHGAAAKGDIGLVQYALTHGQPANSVLDGILPLHAACSGGSELVVKLLLDFGADVNAPRLPRRYTDKKTEGGTIIGSSGSTPLHFAAANGHASIVKILLQQGADPTRADKHGTKAETLAINFGHDQVATMLREWEATHPPLESQVGSATGGSPGDGPPSPSKSRRLPIKRSLENLLTRKGHGVTLAQTPAIQVLSPLNIDPNSPFAGFNGTITPASSSSEAFTVPPSGSRRPSLPHIFETPPPSSNKPSHRPRSAGGDREGQSTPNSTSSHHHTLPARRLASKLSSIFKKSSDHHQPPALVDGYGASSPNLLEFLAAPAEIARSRPRSSVEEARPSNTSRSSLDRDRSGVPNTAPALRTAFFNQSPTQQHEDSEPLAPLPSMLSRTSRSNSQTRYAPDYRQRTDSSTTISSGNSSYDAQSQQQVLQSMALHNNWARLKRDRSASEGAGGVGKRSPLINSEWTRDDDGDIVKKELPGVIADDDEDQSTGTGGRAIATSPEPIERTKQLPALPATKRPSMASGDSANSAGSGHNRTSSTQSTKNLRFELPATGDTSAMVTSPFGSPLTTSPVVSLTSPMSPPPAELLPKKALRPSPSTDSLPKGKDRSPAMHNGRPFSAGKAEGSAGQVYDNAEEEGVAAEEAEEADSVGEPLWNNQNRTAFRSASMGSGYPRPLLSNLSPTTPASATSLLFSPGTATTTSSGGRPWTLPDGYNTSQTSLPSPGGGGKSYPSLSVLGSNGSKPPPNPADGDSRLRGASVSSSKSTDTTSTSSANVATASSSNLASDSSGPQLHSGPSWSTSTSTVSVGTTAKGSIGSVARTVRPGRIAISSSYRHPYEIEDYDSSSSDKYSKASPPLPVLMRTVNSHAQAHALVQKAEKEILDLADLPPDSAGMTGEALSAQLAAYGQSLALEKRFAKGEAQKTAWANRRGLEDDSDEDEADTAAWDEETKYPRGVAEAFVPQVKKKGSIGTLIGGNAVSPTLQRVGSLEFSSGGKPTKSRGAGRTKSTKSRNPVRPQTSPTMPIRTTPSNVGPPVSELKTPQPSSDDPHLSHLILHGIEITKTLPTPTDSPHSTVDLAATQSGGRHVGVDEAMESPTGDGSSSPIPQTAPLIRSRTPDIMVSEFHPVSLLRINTAPPLNEKVLGTSNLSMKHARTASSGNDTMLMGPADIPPRSESRMNKRFGGLKNLVQTLKGKS